MAKIEPIDLNFTLLLYIWTPGGFAIMHIVNKNRDNYIFYFSWRFQCKYFKMRKNFPYRVTIFNVFRKLKRQLYISNWLEFQHSYFWEIIPQISYKNFVGNNKKLDIWPLLIFFRKVVTFILNLFSIFRDTIFSWRFRCLWIR